MCLVYCFFSVIAAIASIPAQGHQILSADDILRKSSDAMGGSNAFARLRESWIERKLILQSDNGSKTITTHQFTVFPNRMTMIALADGETSFYRYQDMHISASTSDNILQDANEGTTAWFRGFYWREWWVLYARFARNQLDDVLVKAGEPILEEGNLYHVLHIEPQDTEPYTLHIDNKSWRPIKRVFKSGENNITDLYTDFQKHDGILFPMMIKSYVDGKQSEDIHYSNISFLFKGESKGPK